MPDLPEQWLQRPKGLCSNSLVLHQALRVEDMWNHFKVSLRLRQILHNLKFSKHQDPIQLTTPGLCMSTMVPPRRGVSAPSSVGLKPRKETKVWFGSQKDKETYGHLMEKQWSVKIQQLIDLDVLQPIPHENLGHMVKTRQQWLRGTHSSKSSKWVIGLASSLSCSNQSTRHHRPEQDAV